VALECKGSDISAPELYVEIIKDRAYFGKTGGVTLSGGEVLLQSHEARELLRLLKENGVHTAVDTCGFCKESEIKTILPFTDLFLYDIKAMDENQHIGFTGQSNAPILRNFRSLVEGTRNTGKHIWIRTPVIPDATDTEDNVREIARFIRGSVDKWELCAFNHLCLDKYKRLSIAWDFERSELMTRGRMQELTDIALSEGVTNVCWTGMTRD
jgi:pyruvate formate lyase activating enzyme